MRVLGLLYYLNKHKITPYWLSFCIIIIHTIGVNSDYSHLQGFIAGIGAVIVVNIIVILQRSKKERLPILEWVFIQYYVFWLFPVFFEGVGTSIISFSQLQRSGFITISLISVILFMLFVLLGYYFTLKYFHSFKYISSKKIKKIKHHMKPVPTIRLIVYAVMTLIISFNILLLELEITKYFYVLFSFFSFLIAQLLFIFEINTFKSNRLLKGSYKIFIVSCILVGLASSRLYYVLLPLVILALTFYTKNKDIKIRYVIIIILLLVFLNPVKIIYRDIVGYRSDTFAETTISEIISAWNEALVEVWGDYNESVQRNIKTVIYRINELSTIALTFLEVPHSVEYEYGKTWVPIFYNFIPRLLWEDKPIIKEVTNDYFNITLGVQSYYHAKRTTLVVPTIADGYFNFGWFGIIMSGILSGILYSIVQQIYTPYHRFRFVSAFYILANIRSTSMLASLYGGIVQSLFVVWLVTKLLELSLIRKYH